MATTAYPRHRLPPAAYMSDVASVRSSSETTAATIFSMYEDPLPPNPKHAPPVPVLDPKYRSMERPVSMLSDRSREYGHARRGSNRRSYGQLENTRPSIERPASYGRNSRLLEDPGPSRMYPVRQSSLQPESRTPSPRLTTNTLPYPSTSSPVSPESALLTPAERERRTSSKHSILTSQTNHTTPTSHTEYTTRHSTEDADAFRIRATYAKLEVEGVPGDGWLEGVERTRTRVVSAASAAVLEASKGAGGKGSNVSAEEEARLRSTDRYGFFSQPAPKHEGRLVLLPALPLKTFASPHKPAAIPAATQLPTSRTLNALPVPSIDPKEDARISKWERMLVPATQPGQGGVGGGWTWDGRKVRKRTERVFKGVPDRWRSAAWGALVEEPRSRSR